MVFQQKKVIGHGTVPFSISLMPKANTNAVIGTLIKTSAVFTATHCLYEWNSRINAERVIVQLAKYNRELSHSNAQEFRAYRNIIHNYYNRRELTNDIALIRLATEAVLTDYVRPICLWDINKSGIAELLYRNGIAVCRRINEKDKSTDVLNQANMPVVSLAECLQ